MSPRPRKVSDLQVFAATQRAMRRLGPGELTLAAIAAEAGVTAGALVQRFGSKRALLLALADASADGTEDFIAEFRSRRSSPLATLRAFGECVGDLAPSATGLARNLAYLEIDLTDRDFRVRLERQGRTTRAALEDLVADAVADGQLVGETDVRTLAHTVEIVLNGALLTWAVYREGPAKRFVRAAVDAVLAPYVIRHRHGPRRRAALASTGRGKRQRSGH